jgi:hypothetical protein
MKATERKGKKKVVLFPRIVQRKEDKEKTREGTQHQVDMC